MSELCVPRMCDLKIRRHPAVKAHSSIARSKVIRMGKFRCVRALLGSLFERQLRNIHLEFFTVRSRRGESIDNRAVAKKKIASISEKRVFKKTRRE